MKNDIFSEQQFFDSVASNMLIHSAFVPTPKPKALTPLEPPLNSLVRAALAGHLRFPAKLVDAQVADLGAYVLNRAARYATGKYTERRLRDLWEAHGIWVARRRKARQMRA